MDHVPRGLDYRHSSTNQHAAKQAGTVSSGQPHVASDGKHCQEEGCTKAPSYGWEGVPEGEGSIAVMCAQVTDRIVYSSSFEPCYLVENFSSELTVCILASFASIRMFVLESAKSAC